MRTSRHRTRASARGFTLIEVIMALGIMTVGALALVGFQRQVSRGNRFARDQAVASQIAENWLERLKVDARRWTQTNGRDQTGWPTEGALLANTQWLSAIAGNNGVWQPIPIPAGTPFQAAFDANGFDIAPGPHRFCAYMRLHWVYFGHSMRADIRVLWLRDNALPSVINNFALCGDPGPTLNQGAAGSAGSHQVILSTVLKAS